LVKRNHKQCQDDGLVIEYYSNGDSCEGYYQGGVEEGAWRWWDENGNKRKACHYKEGLKDGLWQRWNKEGDLEETQTYKNGLLHGPLTKCFSNERKNYDQNFKETKTDRGGSLLDKNLTNTEIYQNGKLVE